MPPARIGNMSPDYENNPFSLLPYRRPPWREFALIMGVQAIAVFILAWVGVLNLGVLPSPVRDYHFIRLVDTPPPVNLEPAPAKEIPVTRVARIETPSPGCTSMPPPVVNRSLAPWMRQLPPTSRSQLPNSGSSADRGGDSAATGKDKYLFYREFGRAHHCCRTQECANRWVWRSQWCARSRN